jgi:hypothetical protein
MERSQPVPDIVLQWCPLVNPWGISGQKLSHMISCYASQKWDENAELKQSGNLGDVIRKTENQEVSLKWQRKKEKKKRGDIGSFLPFIIYKKIQHISKYALKFTANNHHFPSEWFTNWFLYMFLRHNLTFNFSLTALYMQSTIRYSINFGIWSFFKFHNETTRM